MFNEGLRPISTNESNETVPMMHELSQEYFDNLLREGQELGSGNDGIVFLVKGLDVSETVASHEGVAAKILKVYDPGKGRKEAQMQHHAQQVLLRSAMSVAKIPDILQVGEQHLNNDTQNLLKQRGAFLEGQMADVLIMEYIDGQTVAEQMYNFVLKNESESEYENGSFSTSQKLSKVAQLLAFEVPQVASLPEERESLRAQTQTRNDQKLLTYLKRHNFRFPSDMFDKLQNTIHWLHENGIFHNDLHIRNVMIDARGEIYLIDFGRSTFGPAEHVLSDHGFLKFWGELGVDSTVWKAKERAKIREGVLKGVERLKKSKSDKIARLEAGILKNIESELDPTYVLSNSDQRLREFLMMLVAIYQNNSQLQNEICKSVECLSQHKRATPAQKKICTDFLDIFLNTHE